MMQNTVFVIVIYDYKIEHEQQLLIFNITCYVRQVLHQNTEIYEECPHFYFVLSNVANFWIHCHKGKLVRCIHITYTSNILNERKKYIVTIILLYC